MKLFKEFSFLFRYQIDLEEPIKGSDFIFDCVNLLHCKCHEINLKRSESNIDSPYWIKKPNNYDQFNDDDKCFQYAATVALYHEEIRTNMLRTSKRNPFIDKYNWKETNYPSGKDNWKIFEKNTPTIALDVNVKKVNISPAYISKRNFNYENETILLMIPNGKRWSYLSDKNYQHF